jgi:hypothetical protein
MTGVYRDEMPFLPGNWTSRRSSCGVRSYARASGYQRRGVIAGKSNDEVVIMSAAVSKSTPWTLCLFSGLSEPDLQRLVSG